MPDKILTFCICLCSMILIIQCVPVKTYEECISDCNEQQQKCVRDYKAAHPDSGPIKKYNQSDNFKSCYAECEKYPKKEENPSE